MKRAASGESRPIADLSGGMSPRAVHMKLRRLLEQMERSPYEYVVALDRGLPGRSKQIQQIEIDWKGRIRYASGGWGVMMLKELVDMASNYGFTRQFLATEILEVSDERIIGRWLNMSQFPNQTNRNSISNALARFSKEISEIGDGYRLGPAGKAGVLFESLSDEQKLHMQRKTFEQVFG